MPKRDIGSSLDYLRALTEYIEALERVRNHAKFLCEALQEGVADDRVDVEVLLERIRMADDVNPVMKCGS